nr:response regulator [Sphingomonas arenae]
MIVEDEFLIAMDLQLRLEAHGWRVVGPAATIRDALELVEQEPPDVALLDVHLGDQLITPVAECLKARGIPFAVASAFDWPERVGGDVLAGVPNAGKPTSERRLLSALKQLTGE